MTIKMRGGGGGGGGGAPKTHQCVKRMIGTNKNKVRNIIGHTPD